MHNYKSKEYIRRSRSRTRSRSRSVERGHYSRFSAERPEDQYRRQNNSRGRGFSPQQPPYSYTPNPYVWIHPDLRSDGRNQCTPMFQPRSGSSNCSRDRPVYNSGAVERETSLAEYREGTRENQFRDRSDHLSPLVCRPVEPSQSSSRGRSDVAAGAVRREKRKSQHRVVESVQRPGSSSKSSEDTKKCRSPSRKPSVVTGSARKEKQKPKRKSELNVEEAAKRSRSSSKSSEDAKRCRSPSGKPEARRSRSSSREIKAGRRSTFPSRQNAADNRSKSPPKRAEPVAKPQSPSKPAELGEKPQSPSKPVETPEIIRRGRAEPYVPASQFKKEPTFPELWGTFITDAMTKQMDAFRKEARAHFVYPVPKGESNTGNSDQADNSDGPVGGIKRPAEEMEDFDVARLAPPQKIYVNPDHPRFRDFYGQE